jgi:uncharacterized protein YjbI with pentapeptide repeats
MNSKNFDMDNKINKEHYEFLVRCAKKNNIKEWNEWYDKQRVQNENFKLYLEKAHLENYDLSGAHLEYADLSGAHLEYADLSGAHLEYADLSGAHLENNILTVAYLEYADLTEAHLENAYLMGAHLEYAQLHGTYLGNAYLEGAHLDNVILRGAYLDNIDLSYSYLNNAELINISFRNKKGEFIPFICKKTLFRNAVFSTKECYTKTEEKKIIKAMSKAQLNNMSFSDPIFGRKVRDEAWLYNWKKKNSKGIKKIKRFLWCTTCDYGRNIWRWVIMSLIISLLFGFVILLYQDSFNFKTANEQLAHWYNAFYCSILTFTTSGCGNVTPKLTSFWAQFVITIEVILGYVMLGALISILVNKLARRND